MNVLGIGDSFVSGAAVVRDGRIVAAVNEERLDRNKMSTGFPRRSIAEVLRVSGLRPSDVDTVAVATNNLFWRPECLPYNDYFRESKGGLRDAFLRLGGSVSTLLGDVSLARDAYHGIKGFLTRERRGEIPRVLREDFGIGVPVEFVDHHLSHAAAAYFTSGMPEATVVTFDGAGDGKCSRVYAVRSGRFEEIHSLSSYDSIGNYYAYVTHLSGFKAHKHEGKITGLAAYGEPAYRDILERYIAWNGPDIRNIGRCFDHSAIRKLEADLPADFSPEDLSATIQIVLEEAVTAYVDHWVGRSGIAHVAVAGGVFANVKLNQRVHEMEGVRSLFVHPGMGDDGLAVGAALFESNRLGGWDPKPVIDDVYLGPEYSGAEVDEAIDAAGVRVVEPAGGLERTVAEFLAAGKTVARCAGRMEYGPRALGNRTIMYQTTDSTVNHWLNRQLSRTEFMPFAPVTLWDERHRCYRGLSGAEEAARFMTVTFDCSDEMKSRSPAVVHVDGTARPQLIRRQDNPSYFGILEEYHALTGIPSLINTSFNIHEEPIVNTPAEAIRAFEASELDVLVLGPRIIVAEGDDRAPRRSRRERMSA